MAENKQDIDNNDNVALSVEQGVAEEQQPVVTPEDEESAEDMANELPYVHLSQLPVEAKTLEDVIQSEAVEEQNVPSQFSISKTLGGVLIARAVQKQMGLLVLIAIFLIIYISNRYMYQKKLVEIDRMESRLVEARYKAIVCTSILTEKSRESNILTLLSAYGDSTLAIPQDPPYLIKVEDEN